MNAYYYDYYYYYYYFYFHSYFFFYFCYYYCCYYYDLLLLKHQVILNYSYREEMHVLLKWEYPRNTIAVAQDGYFIITTLCLWC